MDDLARARWVQDLNTRSRDADDALGGLERLDNAEVVPLRDTEQAPGLPPGHRQDRPRSAGRHTWPQSLTDGQGDPIGSGPELTELRWVSATEAGDLMSDTHEPVRLYLQQALGNLRPPQSAAAGHWA